MRQVKITVTVKQEGQSRKYADSEYRYQIEVEGDFPQDKVLRFCRNCLNGGGVAYEEWNKVQKGHVFESNETAATYFNGYYKFSQSIVSQDQHGVVTKAVYDYSVTIPYCD